MWCLTRSVLKQLREGPPPDWNEMLVKTWEESPQGGRGSARTTAPDYTNRNGQTVIRRTDTPGNDHNQVVYELESGRLREPIRRERLGHMAKKMPRVRRRDAGIELLVGRSGIWTRSSVPREWDATDETCGVGAWLLRVAGPAPVCISSGRAGIRRRLRESRTVRRWP